MGKLIYKRKVISGSPHTTDAVESGNTSPVSSDAVNGALTNLRNKVLLATVNANTGTINLSESYKNFGFILLDINSYYNGTYIGSSIILDTKMLAGGNDAVRYPFFLATTGFVSINNITDTSMNFAMIENGSATGWINNIEKVYGIK